MLKARASSPRKAKAVTEKSNLGMGREGGREAEVCSARPPQPPSLQGDPPSWEGTTSQASTNVYRFLRWWPGES